MKNAKIYLAHYQNWENTNAEELWRLWNSGLRLLNVLTYVIHSIFKLSLGFLLNTNYLVRHHCCEQLPEEVSGSFIENRRWGRGDF